MSDRKVWTVEEANALLPHLAPALVELRDKLESSVEIRVAITRGASSNGGSTKRDKWNRTLARVQALLERLEEWPIELKDPSVGLVDFPTIIEGRDAYLCWKLGEPEVGYWHFVEDGYGGRRPL